MRPAGDVVTRDPLNAETPWDALREPLTPVGSFFTRNNHAVPGIAPADWRLSVAGLFEAPRVLSLDDLARLPRREAEVVMECAGNGRTRYRPKAEGTPWRDRAVGCARFEGVSLADALRACRARPEAVEIVFRGADSAPHGGRPRAFERSLPVDVALGGDAMIATRMNGAPLAPEHGAPARLVVPGWYGVASVKWIVEARAVAEPFAGHFQRERYVYERTPGEPRPPPVREMRVKSLVVSPPDGAQVRAGREVEVRGWAWSGAAPVEAVEVSTDGGRAWKAASLDAPRGPRAWRGFSLPWRPEAPGEAVLLARARDALGRVQPDEPEWNVHGYGHNAPVPVRVRVAP